jgi:hypothetical protein
MGRVVLETSIRAPIERCFDLARSVDVHCRTSAFTSERAVAPGRTTGLLEAGDLVTFEGRHFGLRLRFTARVVEMQRPVRFVDEAVRSAFRSFRHVHEFSALEANVTRMRDVLEWTPGFGVVGRVVDRVALERHLRSYLETNRRGLKALAEEQM